MLQAIGAKTMGLLESTGEFSRFSFKGFKQSLITFFKPRNYALIWTQMYLIGVLSVPIVMITGAFVGMILGIQAYPQLAGMNLEEHLGVLINVAVVNELGPVLAAVMLAGRVGGALTAELGTMRVTEQIDAVRSMGIDPIFYLVAPRFLACLLLTPILIIFADLLGVFGGYVIGVWHYGINSYAYWEFSAYGVEMWDVVAGIIKGFAFGGIIAIISCYKGFTCGEGAHGVGKACTEAFVASFISILVIDFVLVVIFNTIYDTLWVPRTLIG